MKNLFSFLVILGLTLCVNSANYSQDFGPAQINQSKVIQDVTGDFNPLLTSGSDLSTNYEYDAVTGTWGSGPLSPKNQSRTCCVYITVSGVKYIYQFGGGAGAQLTSIARFNIKAQSWALLGSVLTRDVSAGTAINVGDSVIYIFGGNSGTATLGSTQKYNVFTGVTTVMATMTNLVTDALVVRGQGALADYIYVIGGGTGLFGAGYVSAVDVYKISTNTYTPGTSYPIIAGMMGGGNCDNVIISAGGWDGVTGIANAYKGTITGPFTITWVPIPNYPGGGVTRTASYPMSLGANKGVMFTGGALLGATLQNKTYFWNCTCGLWDSTSNLPVARSNMKAAGRGDNVMWVPSGFTTVGVGNTDSLTITNIICGTPTVDVYAIDNIYALGKVPTPWGCPDTICYRLRRIIPNPNPILIRVKIINIDPNPGSIKHDTTYTLNISHPNPFDTLISYVRPWNITNWKKDSIVIQAIPKAGETEVNNNFKSWRQNVTCNAWNWADPGAPPDGGVGFNGGVGTFVACFRNTCPIPVPIWAVDHCFFNLAGAGNQPYRIYIFGQGAAGAPGPLLYASPMLTSPPGTATPPQRVRYTITPAVQIPANSKFYVGIVQKGIVNIAACYQNETPVKTKRFFFSVDTTGIGPWTDFGPVTAPFRLDIQPVTTTNVLLGAWLEGFFNGNTMIADTTYLDARQSTAPFALVETSTKVLQSNGTAIFPYCKLECDVPYWFVLRHRNHIATWTNGPQLYNCDLPYNFRTAASKAFGNNMTFVPGPQGGFATYTGDVDQDGCVSLADCAAVDDDALNFVAGYVVTDLNGDQIVDLTDLAYCENNSFNFVCVVAP
ncbi:MAG: hypothetical protein ABI840_08695 [bacterium]